MLKANAITLEAHSHQKKYCYDTYDNHKIYHHTDRRGIAIKHRWSQSVCTKIFIALTGLDRANFFHHIAIYFQLIDF
jgi:hypothetical protein